MNYNLQTADGLLTTEVDFYILNSFTKILYILMKKKKNRLNNANEKFVKKLNNSIVRES